MKILITSTNFHSEMFEMPYKIGVTHRDFYLLIEAYRRKHFLETKCPEFMGLGVPSQYKSKLFEPSFGEIARVSNWYKLTKEGKAKMKQLEAIIEIKSSDKSNINLKIFNLEL